MTLTEKIHAVDELAQIIRTHTLHSIGVVEYVDDPEQGGICTHELRLFKQWLPGVRLLVPANTTREEVLDHLKRIEEHVSTAEWPLCFCSSKPEVHYDGEMLRAVADNLDTPDPDIF